MKSFAIILGLAAIVNLVFADGPCVKQHAACVCEKNDGTVVDLTPLKHKHISAAVGIDSLTKFTLRPCMEHRYGVACDSIEDSDKKVIGCTKFVNYENGLALELQAGKRTYTIKLICSNQETNSLVFVKENPPSTYVFELESQYACTNIERTNRSNSLVKNLRNFFKFGNRKLQPLSSKLSFKEKLDKSNDVPVPVEKSVRYAHNKPAAPPGETTTPVPPSAQSSAQSISDVTATHSAQSSASSNSDVTATPTAQSSASSNSDVTAVHSAQSSASLNSDVTAAQSSASSNSNVTATHSAQSSAQSTSDVTAATSSNVTASSTVAQSSASPKSGATNPPTSSTETENPPKTGASEVTTERSSTHSNSSGDFTTDGTTMKQTTEKTQSTTANASSIKLCITLLAMALLSRQFIR